MLREQNLVRNASYLDDGSILNLARELETLLQSASHMCYPDKLNYSRIPHDAYNHGTAITAQGLASKIVEKCEGLISMHE